MQRREVLKRKKGSARKRKWGVKRVGSPCLEGRSCRGREDRKKPAEKQGIGENITKKRSGRR